MATLNHERFTLKNGTEVLIRAYEAEDADLAIKFIKQVATETTHTLKYAGMPDVPRDRLITFFSESLSHPVNLNIGAFAAGELIGNLRFYQKTPNHPWTKHIAGFGMAVSRDYWGQGIASKMLLAMDTHAKTCGINRIEAEVRTTNDRGVSLYTKNGFKIEGLREKAALIDGAFQDEFYIAKILS